MKTLRLLAMTTSYPLRPGSSAGIFIQSLYRHLSAACAIEVVCPADSNRTEAAIGNSSASDIRVHAVRYAPRAWRTLAQGSGGVVTGLQRSPWKAILLPGLLLGLFWRCLLLAGRADLIHANWSVCGAMAGVVGRLRRKPVITTLRGSDVARSTRSMVDRWILDLAVRNSRIVICVSEAMAENLRAKYPQRSADIHACLNGADDAFFQIDRKLSVDASLRVLAVGNLIRLKGFDVLVEAVARARHRDQIHVWIVGGGPERESLLSQAASLGVSSCFTFAGTLPATDMPKCFSEADIFVLSSRSEGRPNVVVEALASGLPVISTALKGVQGMVNNGDNGWLVAVDDADALAVVLDQAVGNRTELHRRGERARAFARVRIGTWADTARCYEAVFQATLTTDERHRSSCAE